MTAASRPSDLIFMADIFWDQRGCGGLWAFACLFVCPWKLRDSGWLWTSGRGHGRLLANSPDHAMLPVKSRILQSPISPSPRPPPSLPHGGWHDLFRGQREEPQGKRASLDMLLEMEIAFPKPSSSLAHSGNEPPQT